MSKFRKALAWFVILVCAGSISRGVANADEPVFQMSKNPQIYFVMLDRFANGNPANDSGNIAGGKYKSGYDPTSTGFYHGGDLAGLTSKISYIKSLGFNAIWVTPVVRQVTVSPDESSAGYHGYWGAGFDQVDPHLGSMQDFKDFVSAAHAQGLGVILDIVANHTGDVIYSSAGSGYSDTDFFPYLLRSGKPFDASKLAGSKKFPKLSQLNPDTTFPNPPLLNNADAFVKHPAWLNNVRNYHNRGNSTWQGESNQFGDFFGLDDLFTESPVVVNGLIKIYADWITKTGIDGFRIDTAKHVNKEFWRAFLPAMRTAAKTAGKNSFPMWGEVYDSDENQTSYWIKNASFYEVLDFPMQSAFVDFINNGSTSKYVSVLNGDDVYSSTRSNAGKLITFLGNHDMGRIGSFITKVTGNNDLQLSRATMAHALLFATRGNPAVYYGDEFGLTGNGDQQARQDLFPTSVTQWKTQARIGGLPIANGSSFDTTNPIQEQIQAVSALRLSDEAFTSGPQVLRFAGSNLLVFSRINLRTGNEYLCAFNTSNSPTDRLITAGVGNSEWTKVAGNGTLESSGNSARLKLAANDWAIFKSSSSIPTSNSVGIVLSPIVVNYDDASQYKIQAKVTPGTYRQVNFYRKAPKEKWALIGSDNAPLFNSSNVPVTKDVYRIFPLRSSFKKFTKYQMKAELVTLDNHSVTSKAINFTAK